MISEDNDDDWWWWWWWWYGGHFLVYLTVIPRVHVGYEMVHVDSQQGAWH